MTRDTCPDCGKQLYPDSAHTCTPLALKLADWLERSWKFYDEQHMKAAAELRRLQAENEALRAEIEADERNLCQLTDELAASRREVDALKAERDRLMLEFCPDEMTQQQKTEWAAHQNVNWYPIQYEKRKFKEKP